MSTLSDTVSRIHPWVWWVKINEGDLEGPHGFRIAKDGSITGVWFDWDRWINVEAPVSIADLRRFGYERCFCDPTEKENPADDCPAHAFAGMGDRTP